MSVFSGKVQSARRDGLQLRITDLIGTYTDPHILIAYSNGEVRQEFTFVYVAEIEFGELKIDDESKEAAWVPLSSAVELPVAESQRRRLKDIMECQKERRMFLRYGKFGTPVMHRSLGKRSIRQGNTGPPGKQILGASVS